MQRLACVVCLITGLTLAACSTGTEAPVTTSAPHTATPIVTLAPTAPPTIAPVETAAPAQPVAPGNGATARCNDGTYSYAQHHQGACSQHGGVAEFYN
jgi:hypothetical protein